MSWIASSVASASANDPTHFSSFILGHPMSTPPSHLIVLGSVNTDLVIHGSRLPRPGETVLGGKFFQAAGGKGANQAVAAARASETPVTFIAAVGDDDYGREALGRFNSENLCCDFIRTVPNNPTGVAIILVDGRGENMIGVASGANMHLSAADVNAVPDKTFADARVLLTCLESPLPAVTRAFERAKAAGLTTILNSAPVIDAAAVIDLLPLVDVVTPNAVEASALSGVDVFDEASALSAARVIQKRGCPRVIVTLGSRGSLLVESKHSFIPSRPVTPVDSTGAGDAFSATLAVALAEGRPLDEAVSRATTAASICVSRQGAQPSLATREEIDAADA
jgi:ribokinase